MKFYSNLAIPARTFFEIIESGDLSHLIISGKPSSKHLSNAWTKIYDLYYEKRQDSKMSMIFEHQKKMKLIEFKINVATNCMKALVIVDFPKEQLKEVCNALKKLNISIDPDKRITEEVLNKLQIDINNMKIQYDDQQAKIKNLSKGVKSDFEDICVNIENCLERSISENISMAKFISLEKSAIKKNNYQKAQAAKRKRKK